MMENENLYNEILKQWLEIQPKLKQISLKKAINNLLEDAVVELGDWEVEGFDVSFQKSLFCESLLMFLQLTTIEDRRVKQALKHWVKGLQKQDSSGHTLAIELLSTIH